jgi:hypothetical protein
MSVALLEPRGSCESHLPRSKARFYREALLALNASDVPYLVGGTYALSHYTGITRRTKDLDIFVQRADLEAILDVLAGIGCRTEIPFPHWLGKAFQNEYLIDVIHASGDGSASVDGLWFENAERGAAFGVPVLLNPAEEMIWSKAFIMERDRCDGADIGHLLLARAERLSWPRLLERFGPHWRVLFAHLVLFGFSYPSRRDLIPSGVLHELMRRMREETDAAPPQNSICNGTLLSRSYRIDVERLGFEDGRVAPAGSVNAEELEPWLQAFPKEFD